MSATTVGKSKKSRAVNYRNEALFSEALCSSFTTRHIFHQRIESGTTGRGIPDMFAILSEGPVWLELKRVHSSVFKYATVTIPWRPRQQPWMYNEWRKGGVMCYTLAAFDDGILKIPMVRIYKNKIVDLNQHKDIVLLRSVKDVT